jgi:hypothetical protein
MKIAFKALQAKLPISEENILTAYLINYSEFNDIHFNKIRERFEKNHIILINNANSITFFPNKDIKLLDQVKSHLANNLPAWELVYFFEPSTGRL